MVGGPPRAGLHTTETSHKWGFYRSKVYYSIQFLYNPLKSGKVEILQSIDLNLASRALFNGPHSVQTNRMGSANPQLVIVGYAKDSPSLPREIVAAMAEFMVWSEEKQKVPAIFPLVFQGGESYGSGGVGRMSISEWQKFTGICGHQDVPDGNLHWDPGKIPVSEFKQAIAALKGRDAIVATYRTVTNVPVDDNGNIMEMFTDIIDRHIVRGIIRVGDKAPDDWARDGRLWIFLDRMLTPIESELDDKDTKIKSLSSSLAQHLNSHPSSGTSGKDTGLRDYLQNTPK